MQRKQIQLVVTIDVRDHGELDVERLRAGVALGIEIMRDDGRLTPPEDETTEIERWTVTHVGTKDHA